jgi:hypothetical protein
LSRNYLRGSLARFDHGLLRFGIPDVLHAEATPLEARIDSKLYDDAPSLKLALACQLFGAFRENVVQAALQTFALFSLPFAVILRIEEYHILSRNVRWPPWGGEPFTLHCLFNFTSDRYEKVIPLRTSAWLSLLVKVFFAIDPLPKALQPTMQAH